MSEWKFENSSSALIGWGDKILLFHRDDKASIPEPDCWQLPGGKIENGESPRQAVVRELNEEVSHSPRKLKFFKKIKRNGYVNYLFVGFVDDREARLFHLGEGEGQAIGFFDLNEALKLKLTSTLQRYIPLYKKQINQALKTRSLPQIDL